MRLGLILLAIRSNSGSRGYLKQLFLCLETPESHLVASYTLCGLKKHLSQQRAVLDLINSAESQPATPVNQCQPVGTKYRPPFGSEELTEIEAVCLLYQNPRFPPHPLSTTFAFYFGTVQKLFDWVRCQCFGGSLPHSCAISAGALTGVSAAVPLRHGHSQFPTPEIESYHRVSFAKLSSGGRRGEKKIATALSWAWNAARRLP